MPTSLLPVLDYITSPGIIIPTLVNILLFLSWCTVPPQKHDKDNPCNCQVLLTLTIWYQWTLTSMLRESTEDLKAQVLNEKMIHVSQRPHISQLGQTDQQIVNVTFIAVLAAKKDSSSNSGMKFRIIFWRWGIVVDALSRKSQKIQKDCCGNQSSCLESFYVELSGEAETLTTSYYAAAAIV